MVIYSIQYYLRIDSRTILWKISACYVAIDTHESQFLSQKFLTPQSTAYAHNKTMKANIFGIILKGDAN